MPIRRIGRPGLLGTMARTAVIAGTANAVNRGMNRATSSRAQTQAESAAHREQQYNPSPPAEDDMIAKLKKLGDLHAAGVLSDDEFASAKAKLLT